MVARAQSDGGAKIVKYDIREYAKHTNVSHMQDTASSTMVNQFCYGNHSLVRDMVSKCRICLYFC